MTPTGPVYCETGHGLLFMAEPVNTITNAFIIVAGVYALLYVRRAKIGMPAVLAVLLFLLFATGVGSFAWHAFRTPVALAFDAIPGLLFLLVMAGLWFRALYGNLAGIAGVLGLIVLAGGAPYLWWHGAAQAPRALVFVPSFFVVAAIGGVLALLTVPRYGRADGAARRLLDPGRGDGGAVPLGRSARLQRDPGRRALGVARHALARGLSRHRDADADEDGGAGRVETVIPGRARPGSDHRPACPSLRAKAGAPRGSTWVPFPSRRFASLGRE